MPKSNSKHAALLRKFHAVCGEQGLSPDEKAAIVLGYGHTSSRNLSEAELSEIIAKLNSAKSEPQPTTEADKWRKRVMASIGGWLRRCRIEESTARIHAIACRASGFKSFNQIPIARLRNLYYEFRNKQSDAHGVEFVKAEEIGRLENLN